MKMVNLFRDSGLVLIALFLISFETKAVDNLHGGVDKSIEIYVSITPKGHQTGSKPHYIRLERQELDSLARGETLLCQFNFDKGFQLGDFYGRAPTPVNVRFQFSLGYAEDTKRFETRLWGNIANNSYDQRRSFATLESIRLATQDIEGVNLEVAGQNHGNTPGRLKIKPRGSYNSQNQSAVSHCSIN